MYIHMVMVTNPCSEFKIDGDYFYFELEIRYKYGMGCIILKKPWLQVCFGNGFYTRSLSYIHPYDTHWKHRWHKHTDTHTKWYGQHHADDISILSKKGFEFFNSHCIGMCCLRSYYKVYHRFRQWLGAEQTRSIVWKNDETFDWRV